MLVSEQTKNEVTTNFRTKFTTKFQHLLPIRNASFAQVVGSDLDVNAVAHADADEIFAHLARNMREDFVTIRQRHSEHRSRQHLGHGALKFNRFFFCHALKSNVGAIRPPQCESFNRPKKCRFAKRVATTNPRGPSSWSDGFSRFVLAAGSNG